ncbi:MULTISPECIES: ATP-binding protein [Dehalobacter]|uniref:histidine kinase n=2 Tax=Dehalobacter restrictus TaxID=55583 RepID=A0A857DKA0_9FIRM|nr:MULTISPECIES: ATP-binding protein [Dehalobacter]AHF09980.1 histidine kinase [Dehalobacter restrictus DSM 9455]MCG1024246.1 histidine kinase [Dehalobacter sp.]MDJ0306574.1 ATP-binding protein [Dehalobacter sp.]OCZ50438.1 histidine kinase [Dehalobacter sp. TeCB1]QHA00576.1 histidine kinase [Dehalobacter restrictus]
MWGRFINRQIYYIASIVFIVLGLVYFSACLQQPYIGLNLENVNGQWLITFCDTHGEGYRSGIELGDQILKINGGDPGEYDIVQKWNLMEGTSSIEFCKQGELSALEIIIPKHFDLLTVMSESPTFLLGFIFWLLGFLTWIKRPFLRQARTLFWLLWLFGLVILLTYASGRCLFFAKELEYIAFSAAPVLLIAFFSIFPVLNKNWINTYSCKIAVILSAIILILTVLQSLGLVHLASFIRKLALSNMLIGILISVWNLVQVMRLHKDRPEKNEAGIVLTGMVIGFSPSVVLIALPTIFNMHKLGYTEISTIFVSAVPVSLYYAIVNKYLPDSRRLYKIIITNFLTIIFISLIALYVLYFCKIINTINIEFYLSAFFLSLLFFVCLYFIRLIISKLLERLSFFQTNIGLKQRVAELNKSMTSLISEDHVFEEAVKTLGIDGVFIIVENEQTGCLRKAVGRFRKNRQEQSELEAYFSRNQKQDLEARFLSDDCPAEIFVPFVSQNSTCGIFFGHRYSHIKFEKSELPFLTLLAGQLAYEVLMLLIIDNLTKDINALTLTSWSSQKRNRELQCITNSLIRMIERGKGSLSKEILDGPVQSVLDISRLLKILEKENLGDDTTQQVVSWIRNQINDLNYDLNQTVHNLRPPVLSDLGLIPAIQSLFQDIMLKEPNFIILETEGIELNDHFSEDVEIAAYRFIQKAIINSLRYSGSKKQTVRVELSGDKLELTVKDNGQGFDPDQLEKGSLGGAHFGLAIMKERIESLGGQMLISSGFQRGTTLKATIPVY